MKLVGLFGHLIQCCDSEGEFHEVTKQGRTCQSDDPCSRRMQSKEPGTSTVAARAPGTAGPSRGATCAGLACAARTADSIEARDPQTSRAGPVLRARTQSRSLFPCCK